MSVAEVEAYVCGIPAILVVQTYTKVKGSFSHNAPSDLDYYGYREVEFDVCDRNGRPAPWLERKMTDADWNAAEQKIIDYMEGGW